MELLTETFKTTATGIREIRTDCEAIPLAMEQLKELMGELDEHLKELDERLIAFAEMKDRAVDSFPKIHENLEIIGTNLKNSAESFNGLEKTISDTYTRAAELSQAHITDLETQMNQTAEQVRKTVQDMITQTGNASIQHQTEIREIIDKISETSERCLTETKQKLTTMAEHHTNVITEKMTGITTSWGKSMVGMAEEMERKTIGNNNRQ